MRLAQDQAMVTRNLAHGNYTLRRPVFVAVRLMKNDCTHSVKQMFLTVPREPDAQSRSWIFDMTMVRQQYLEAPQSQSGIVTSTAGAKKAVMPMPGAQVMEKPIRELPLRDR